MGIFVKQSLKIFIYVVLINSYSKLLFCNQIDLKVAKQDFINGNNTLAYTKAAHALGRYGQEIGIMSAITKGIAHRVKIYLDKALSFDDNNVIVYLSKGL